MHGCSLHTSKAAWERRLFIFSSLQSITWALQDALTGLCAFPHPPVWATEVYCGEENGIGGVRPSPVTIYTISVVRHNLSQGLCQFLSFCFLSESDLQCLKWRLSIINFTLPGSWVLWPSSQWRSESASDWQEWRVKRHWMAVTQ